MLKTQLSKSISGQSNIDINGVGTLVVSMNGNIGNDNRVSISKNIIDQKLFSENKDICRKDMEEFEDYVFSLIN